MDLGRTFTLTADRGGVTVDFPDTKNHWHIPTSPDHNVTITFDGTDLKATIGGAPTTQPLIPAETLYRKVGTYRAKRWTGTRESAEQVMEWADRHNAIHSIGYHPSVDEYDDGVQGCPHSPARLDIQTENGVEFAYAGDFVLIDDCERLWSCRKDDLDVDYEPIKD